MMALSVHDKNAPAMNTKGNLVGYLRTKHI